MFIRSLTIISRILCFISLTFLTACAPMINKQNSPEYILRTDSKGASNLDLQHEIFKHESFTQLKKAGLSKGMVVWDIGCGSGVMTEYLAEMVGNTGQVYAIDASEDQIQATKNRIEAAGYKNVTFIVGDINNLDSNAYNKADIVYARFLLMHVNDPTKVIKLMASLLKPNGVLSLQESTMTTIQDEKNNNPDINKLYDLMMAYGVKKGFDYNIGSKLSTICNKSHLFSTVQHYTKNYNTTDHIKHLISLRVDELEDKLVTANLISEDQYKSLQKRLHSFLKDKKSDQCIIVPEQSHVLCIKE